MNVILLSGGGGVRLWPLSTETKSKQFLELFDGDAGRAESILQRVYRQVHAVASDARIVVATGEGQAALIRQQLGEDVELCVEPCRRDTFPAIALSSLYLRDVLGVSEDEGVVVCPVDHYVELAYYEMAHRMTALAEQSKMGLTLMGIEPEYASEKYGYIVPASRSEVSDVLEFREKPDSVTAQKLIDEGALWNAGVFAFRLGYLTQRADEITGCHAYEQLLACYESLQKISFDYAVVEKEQNIQVVRYGGTWRDVGAWDAMCEVLGNPIMGNVVVDSSCARASVINELSIPVVAVGLEDVVIVASETGILVTTSEHAGSIKPIVEGLR